MAKVKNSKYHSIYDNIHDSVHTFLTNNIYKGSTLYIVSAYFKIEAYINLAATLDNIDHLYFLFGEPKFVKNDADKTLDYKIIRLEEFEDNQPISMVTNRIQQKQNAEKCMNWIQKKVSIKSVCNNLLHGKLYLIKNTSSDEHTSERIHALVGSSNFTGRGLGIYKSSNIELNLVASDDRDRDALMSWFDSLWNNKIALVRVTDVKDTVLEYIATLYKENAPQLIYYKTLYHIFEPFWRATRAVNDAIDSRTNFYQTLIWNKLYDFQRDAVRGAINKIQAYNGCILADSVGLGKTFSALAIIKYFELRNCRVLVLCPKKLRNNWIAFTQNNAYNPLLEDKFSYNVLSHTDLGRESGKVGDIDLAAIHWGNYDLVVIDESHNFRTGIKGQTNEDNHRKLSRYEFLMKKVIQEGVDTKILLLSATPVNNDLKDLRNQIYLLTKGKDTLPFGEYEPTIRSIKQTMASAQRIFSDWATPQKNQSRAPEDLIKRLNDHNTDFFYLLDRVTIARSRSHIKRFYKDERIGHFPKRLPVDSYYPEYQNTKYSYDTIFKNISNYKLFIYNPSNYVLPEYKQNYEYKSHDKEKVFSQSTRERNLIGMMRVNFLKRLESSVRSFELTLNRTIEQIDELTTKLTIFDQQHTASASSMINIDENLYLKTLEEVQESEDGDWLAEDFVGKNIQFDLKHLDVKRWLKDLAEDKSALAELATWAADILATPAGDTKLEELKSVIKRKAQTPINANNRKVLIFTAFADTAQYLYQTLLDWVKSELGLDIALVTGARQACQTSFGAAQGTRSQALDFDKILTHFSPKSKNRNKIPNTPQSGEIDILIATDCISEGQNLQDCDYVINYDIHWNPVRLIQRFGRIDRLGSTNEQIQMVNFWATPHLDEYLKLKERVEARMALVDITATAEDNLLERNKPTLATLETTIQTELSYRDTQLKRLQDEVLDIEDLQDTAHLGEFSLDDFRRDLLNMLNNMEESLAALPLGLYAIVPSTPTTIPGTIFCLKAAQHQITNMQTFNTLGEYFLIYITNAGEIWYSFAQTKTILEIFRRLAQSQDKAYDELCTLFNQETQNGENLNQQTELVMCAIRDIKKQLQQQAAAQLGNKRDAVFISPQNISFELITWLIIK